MEEPSPEGFSIGWGNYDEGGPHADHVREVVVGMKYGPHSTFKGRRRWGRHGSGGHPPGREKTGSPKTWAPGPGKPATKRYFDEHRWLKNKAARIRRASRFSKRSGKIPN